MSAPAHVMTAIVVAIGPGRCLTPTDIGQAVGRPGRRLGSMLRRLLVAGTIERMERGCYRLTAAGEALARGDVVLSSSGQRRAVIGPRKPKPRSPCPMTRPRVPPMDTYRQRMWAAMRLKRRFTSADLAILASRDDPKPEENARQWCSHLVKAGYLQVAPHRVPGATPNSRSKVWVLVRDTGWIAPTIRPDGTYHDHNEHVGTATYADPKDKA